MAEITLLFWLWWALLALMFTGLGAYALGHYHGFKKGFWEGVNRTNRYYRHKQSEHDPNNGRIRF
jgi:hypothetical protein